MKKWQKTLLANLKTLRVSRDCGFTYSTVANGRCTDYRKFKKEIEAIGKDVGFEIQIHYQNGNAVIPSAFAGVTLPKKFTPAAYKAFCEASRSYAPDREEFDKCVHFWESN